MRHIAKLSLIFFLVLTAQASAETILNCTYKSTTTRVPVVGGDGWSHMGGNDGRSWQVRFDIKDNKIPKLNWLFVNKTREGKTWTNKRCTALSHQIKLTDVRLKFRCWSQAFKVAGVKTVTISRITGRFVERATKFSDEIFISYEGMCRTVKGEF